MKRTERARLNENLANDESHQNEIKSQSHASTPASEDSVLFPMIEISAALIDEADYHAYLLGFWKPGWNEERILT